MKRSPLLQPLSREHHTALSLAKACERAAVSGDTGQVETACQRASKLFLDELERHFQLEETTLLPLLKTEEAENLVRRTQADHGQLRALQHDLRLNDRDTLTAFAKILAEHVRFEERALFPALEALMKD